MLNDIPSLCISEVQFHRYFSSLSKVSLSNIYLIIFKKSYCSTILFQSRCVTFAIGLCRDAILY